MRELLDHLDAGVAEVYRRQGLESIRPRFVPVMTVLARQGPQAIRAIAEAVGVTHSAASQTVAQLAARGLVRVRAGDDARQRIVDLTEQGKRLLPTVEAESRATARAVRQLDAELPYPLTRLVDEALGALARRSMAARIRDAAQDSTA